MTTRAKMTVASITEHAWGGKTLKLDCRYDSTIPEDLRFQKATPSGSAEFQIDNPAAIEQFKLGDSFYVEFTPVPKAAAS